MTRTKVSPKYQIVIPKDVRERMGLKVGQEVEVIELDGIIEIVPVRHPRELRGRLKGLDASGLRDHRDRL
jgi:AbrB family looped-hinge helix DNA binding protein